MSAERSLPAERMKKMTMKRDKGGENPVKKRGWSEGHNLNLLLKNVFKS